MSQSIRFAAWLCFVCSAGLALFADPPNTIVESPPGSLAWDSIQFVGNVTFTDEQLRNSLLAEPDFLFAAHPDGPANDLGKHAEMLLVKGYRHAGFPDASFVTKQSAFALLCTIDEGPRVRCGSVTVNGASELNVEALIDRLTNPYPDADAFPTYVITNGVSETRWVDKDGKTEKLKDAVWDVGSPVHFDSESELQKQLTAALADLGYSAAIAITNIVPDVTQKTATLVIDVIREGKPDGAAEIVCNGLHINTREQLLALIGLSEGDPVNHELIQSITKRLWDCGRFTSHQVRFDASIGQLQIDLEETVGLPPLDQPISDEAKAFLAARRWLASADVRGDDIEFSCRSGRFSGRAIFSEHGMLAELEISSADQHAGSKQTLTLLADHHGLLINHSDHPGKLLIDMTNIKGRITFTNKFAAAPDPRHVYDAKVAFSVSSKREAGQVPVGHVLDLSPSGWLPLAYKDNLKTHFVDGDLVAQYKDEEVRINSRSGEFKAFLLGDWQMNLRAGVFAAARKRVMTQTMSKANLYDADKAATSLTSYLVSPPVWELVREIRSEVGEDNEPISPELITAVRKLIDSGILTVPDALIAGLVDGTDSDEFLIPRRPRLDQPMSVILREVMASTILRLAPECFTDEGWPLKVTREACLTIIGRGKYTGKVLQQILADPENGPLCHATIARLLAMVDHPYASRFASRALANLNAEDFLRDYQTLATMPGNEQIMATIFAFQSLSQAEIDALLTLSKNESLNSFVRMVHASQTRGPEDAGLFWYQISQDSLRSSLEKLR